MAEWILTKDRLPDRCGMYWVTDKLGRMMLADFYCHEYNVPRWFYDIGVSETELDSIIAWMPMGNPKEPIPYPYEEKRSELNG